MNKHIETIIDTIRTGIDEPRAIHRNLTIIPLKNGYIVRHGGKTLAMVLNNRMRVVAKHKRTALRYVNAVLEGLNSARRMRVSKTGSCGLLKINREGFIVRDEVILGRKWFQL